MSDRNRRNGVSVVICCYNSERRLLPTLQALAGQQTDTPWEIIVVDNASVDATAQAAVEIWQGFGIGIPLRVVREEEPGLGHARRRGIGEARYGFVLFCDDDNWLSSNYVQGVYEILMRDEGIAACGGIGLPAFETAPPEWFDAWKESFALGSQEITGEGGRLFNLYGAGMGLRLEAWDALHEAGFEPMLKDRTGKSLSSSGDTELTYALVLHGYRLHYAPELSFKHYMPEGRLQWSYLKKLFRAFGSDGPVRNMYYAQVSDSAVHKRLHNWNAHLLLSLVRLVKYGVRPPKKGGRSVYFAWSLAYLRQLWRLRKEYRSIWKRIARLQSAPPSNHRPAPQAVPGKTSLSTV